MNEIDTYKYIGILQSRQLQHTKNKKQVTPVMTNWLQEVLKIRVNKKNLWRHLIHTLFHH